MTVGYKAWRNVQDRNGSAKRRKLEYDAIMDNVKRRKAQFTARLQARLERVGECLCYKGTLDHKGYARLNVSYLRGGKGPAQVVTIHAQRLFLILKLGRPLRRGYEAGHEERCSHRTCVLHVEEEHYKLNAMTKKPRDERAAA